MPPVYWILVVDFDKLSEFVENFLPETDRFLFSIHQF